MVIGHADFNRMSAAIEIAVLTGRHGGLGTMRAAGAVFARDGIWLVFSVAAAELFGYLLHRLLHSEVIPFLSRNHLLHHLRHYGPTAPMRKPEYVDATDERFSLGNVGLEWIAPSGLLILMFLGLFAISSCGLEPPRAVCCDRGALVCVHVQLLARPNAH